MLILVKSQKKGKNSGFSIANRDGQIPAKPFLDCYYEWRKTMKMTENVLKNISNDI